MNNAPTQAATGAATPVVFGSQVTVLDVASGEVLTCRLLEAPVQPSSHKGRPADEEPRYYHYEWVGDPARGPSHPTVVPWASSTPPDGARWHHLAFRLVQGCYLLPPGGISQQAPLGAALLGRVAGDVVRVQAPAGTLAYQVLLVVAPR